LSKEVTTGAKRVMIPQVVLRESFIGKFGAPGDGVPKRTNRRHGWL